MGVAAGVLLLLLTLVAPSLQREFYPTRIVILVIVISHLYIRVVVSSRGGDHLQIFVRSSDH